MTAKYIFVLLAVVALIANTSATPLNEMENSGPQKAWFSHGLEGIKSEGQGQVACGRGRRGTTTAPTTAATTTTTAAAGR